MDPPVARVVREAGAPDDMRASTCLPPSQHVSDIPEFSWKSIASTMMARRAYRRFVSRSVHAKVHVGRRQVA